MTVCRHAADPGTCDACYAEDVRRVLAPTSVRGGLVKLEAADPKVKAAAQRLNARQTDLLSWTLQPRETRIVSPPVGSQAWRMRNLRDARESLDNARLHRRAMRGDQALNASEGCIQPRPGDTPSMASIVRQEYDIGDGAKLTLRRAGPVRAQGVGAHAPSRRPVVGDGLVNGVELQGVPDPGGSAGGGAPDGGVEQGQGLMGKGFFVLCAAVGAAIGVSLFVASIAFRSETPAQPAVPPPPLVHVEQVAEIPRRGLDLETAVFTFCDRGNRVYVTYGRAGSAMAVAEGGGPVGCR